MSYGMAGMPGNQRQVGLPRGMSGFPVVGNGLGGLPVRAEGSGDNSLFWVYTYASGVDQFSLTAFNTATGSLGTQIVKVPAGLGTVATNQPVFSADGKYLVAPIFDGTNYYVGIFDASGGPGRVFYVNRFLVAYATGGNLTNLRISPRGQYISCFASDGAVVRYHIYDCTSGFLAPTKIADYTGNSFTTFAPRGFTFSPSGNTGYSASSDEGGSVLIPSLTRTEQQWSGYNQSFRGYSHDGASHLYFSQASNLSPNPNTFIFGVNSTSFTIAGPSIFPSAVCPVAGFSHVAGLSYVADPGNTDSWVVDPVYRAAAGYLRIIDYPTNTTILTSPYYSYFGSQILPVYLTNGDLVHYNATTARREVLRPSTSYGDVTSQYNTATLNAVSAAVPNSTPNTNCWPAFGKQTLYSTI